MANDKWFKDQDAKMRDAFNDLPQERRNLIGECCNYLATKMNKADLSGLESEMAAWMCFSGIALANKAYEDAGYGEMNNLPIVSQMQAVIKAMTEAQRNEMVEAITKVADAPVATAFKHMVEAIKLVDKAKAG